MSDIFDFGFTAVDEDELDVVQKQQQQTAAMREGVEAAASVANQTQERLDKLYNAIIPLLNNLKKNPDKDYILWPNRLEKVDQFEDHLMKIYKG